MFVEAKLRDTVKITPPDFGLPQETAIKNELNLRLANQVVIDLGLCMAVKAVQSIGPELIHWGGDGSYHSTVTFTEVVFRPAIGEVLVGRIRSQSRDHIRISLGFFDDIYIAAPSELPSPCHFDEQRQLWIWDYTDPDEPDSEEVTPMELLKNEKIRFRIKSEQFTDIGPLSTASGPPKSPTQERKQAVAAAAQQQQSATPTHQQDTSLAVPYRIEASIAELGLGLVSWW